MKHQESIIQEQVVVWLQRQYPRVLFTGGFAGEKMKIPSACRRKRMGYRPGSPDLIIFEAHPIYHGLMVEMKAPGGKLSDSQKVFGEHASTNGYCYVVCYNLDEAQQKITKYLTEDIQ